MDSTKLKQIYLSASKFFIHKGYRQTQMIDIAKDVGMAAGSFYNYFTGKKAMFDFTIRCSFDDQYLDEEVVFPIEEINHDDVNVYFQGIIHQDIEQPLKEENLAFEKLIGVVYDFISKYWRGIRILERNEVDWPALALFYYEERKQVFKMIDDYLKTGIEKGEIRQIDNIEYHTRLIIETVAWWGMHRRYDRMHNDIDNNVAKAMVVDVLSHAYKQ